MDVTLAFATFAAILGAWIAVGRRRPQLRIAYQRHNVGEAGFLRRLA